MQKGAIAGEAPRPSIIARFLSRNPESVSQNPEPDKQREDA